MTNIPIFSQENSYTPPTYRPLVTVAIPTYNAAGFIKPTLDSLSTQTYTNYETLVVDDASSDDTCAIIEHYGFSSLRTIRNKVNRGCTYTIPLCAELARGEILVYLCHDDILSPIALERIVSAFRNPEIGANTRPYFFFEGTVYDCPNRVAPPLDPHHDVIVHFDDNYHTIHGLVQTLGQLSAMAFRKSFMKVPFSKDVFTVHVQAFLGILCEHPVVALSDYILAVRTDTSQSRSVPKIYQTSPLESWDRMLHRVFHEPRYARTLHYCRKVICTNNDIGLVQIKCAGGQLALLREIWISIKVWPMNTIRPFFLFWSFITLLMPRKMLRKTIDWLKNLIGPRIYRDVKLVMASSK